MRTRNWPTLVPSLLRLPRRNSRIAFARGVLPGASESSWFEPMLASRNGTGLPVSSTVATMRSVNHGVSLTAGTTVSCAAS